MGDQRAFGIARPLPEDAPKLNRWSTFEFVDTRGQRANPYIRLGERRGLFVRRMGPPVTFKATDAHDHFPQRQRTEKISGVRASRIASFVATTAASEAG